ncbi:MAG: YraN family protein [Lachnospiraceae bacterium]|nr:YraN family protein [Lachnospiraceae bacterium]
MGKKYEETAADHLRSKGLNILECNFRCRIGEIDIIAKDKRTIVFVEVKYRRNKKLGLPSEAVDIRKQITISRVADYYRLINRLPEGTPYRFDVVAILGEEIRWYENAFEYMA